MENARELLGDDLKATTLDPEALEVLMSEVAGQATDREPSALERLRALPSPARLLLGLNGALLLGLVAVLGMGLRADIDRLQLARLVGSLGLLAVSTLAATAVALRGPERPPMTTAGRVAAGLVMALPFLTALIPGFWEGVDSEGALSAIRGCLTFGVPFSLLASGSVLVFNRWSDTPRSRLLAAGLAGGFVGFGALQLHCPGADTVHMLASHASLGLVCAAVLVAGSAAAAMRRSRAGKGAATGS